MELSLSIYLKISDSQIINPPFIQTPSPLGFSWKEAILGGAYLAQIGELSFMLCLAAFNLHIITEFSYSFTISLIAITLVISPFWIAATESILKKSKD